MSLTSVLAHVMPAYMEKSPKSTMLFACVCIDFDVSTRALRETQKKARGLERLQKAFIAELQPFFPVPFFEYEETEGVLRVRPSDVAWHPAGRSFLLAWKHFDTASGASWKNMAAISIARHNGHDKLVLDTTELPFARGLARQTVLITILNHKDALLEWLM